MTKIKLYGLLIIGVILGLAGLRFHWIRVAEQRIEQEAAKASNERMRVASDAEQEVNSLSDDDLRKRASKWVRNTTDY